MRTLAFFLVPAIAAMACGGSSGGGAGGTGGTGGTGGAGCSAIENVGETIIEVAASGTVPAPMGGTIVDGTYVLTKHEAYPPGSATNRTSATLQIAGSTMDLAIVSVDFPSGLKGRASLTTSGTQSTITWLCGGGSGSFDQGYTATDTDLVFIDSFFVSTYTKQ